MERLKAEDLPEIERAELDDAALASFFERVAAEAEHLSVMVKGGAEVRTNGANYTLDAARAAYEAGQVSGLQLRYMHHGHIVMDTLMRRGPQLTLLARMVHG